MPEFKYTARDSSGKTLSGIITTSSKDTVITELDRKGFVIVSVEECRKAANAEKPAFFSFSVGKPRERRVKAFELSAFCKQLATMLKGGVPILNAIRSIGGEAKTAKLKRVLESVSNDLRDGKKFSESLKRYPDVFSTLFTAIVESGEKVGALDKMLLRLADYLAAQDRLARKIKSATAYPLFIVGFFLLAIAGVTLFLIPRFQDVYASFGAKLPAFTLFIFNISTFMVRNILFIVIVIAAIVTALVLFVRRTRKGRVMFDSGVLRIPVFGEIIMKAAISKFCRTLATLLDQGIPVNEAFLLVGRTSGNIIIEEAAEKASKLVTEGTSITEAFNKAGVFPSLMMQMTSVGVDAGSLPELLDDTANFYEDQVDTFVATLTSVIEPILIVSIGAVVGTVVVALYLPIFRLGSAISGN